MRVRHFNIAGVALSNFKHGINTNGRKALLYDSLSIDVANVSAGVDEALIELQEGGGGQEVVVVVVVIVIVAVAVVVGGCTWWWWW